MWFWNCVLCELYTYQILKNTQNLQGSTGFWN